MIRQATARERWLAQQHYSETTKRTYRETLGALEQRWPVYLSQITIPMLVDFLVNDASGEPTGRASSTLSRQRAMIRAFFRWVHRQAWTKTDPAERLDEVRVGRGTVRVGHWLDRAEVATLLLACRDGTDQGLRDEALITTALLTGLRRAELAALQWQHLDLGGESRLQVVHGKGGKPAVVGLPVQAADILRRWRGRQAELRGLPPRRSSPVFPTGQKIGGLLQSLVEYRFLWSQPLSLWGIRASSSVEPRTPASAPCRRTTSAAASPAYSMGMGSTSRAYKRRSATRPPPSPLSATWIGHPVERSRP